MKKTIKEMNNKEHIPIKVPTDHKPKTAPGKFETEQSTSEIEHLDFLVIL